MQISVQALNEFQKTYLLDVYTQSTTIQKSHLNFDQAYLYPFDIFYMSLNIVVTSPKVTNSSLLPILAIGFSGYSNNFMPYMENEEATTMANGTVFPSRYASLTLRRTRISQGFVMSILAVNWALTVLVAYITIASFSAHFRMTDGIVALPITVILTVTALRALYVDSPPFGELPWHCLQFITPDLLL